MASSSFAVVTYQNRTRDIQGTILARDGTTGIVLDPADKLRFKLGQEFGMTPLLDLVSGVSTANGSTVIIDSRGAVGPPAEAASYTIRLGQGDLALLQPGIYDAELLVIDDSENSPPKPSKTVSIGVITVIGTLVGSLGL